MLSGITAHPTVISLEYPTLCFLCFVDTQGNEAVVGEMQARWALSALTGRAPMPTTTVRKGYVEKRQKRFEVPDPPRFPQFVVYTKYVSAITSTV